MNWSERAFLTRWQLALIVLLLFAAVGTSIAVGITAVSASHRVAKVQRDQQANRVTAIRELCEHDNANARHNVEFLKELGSDKRTLRLGITVFKQTKDCQAFAVRTIRQTSR
jgi:Na+-translocating ferredoxin:NAD+ oxidoreductase RnfG subunit